MSEFGLKIKNIEASTLFEYNNGVRDHFEYKDAMFSNSLLKTFLLEHGLDTWKGESTRDIICLEFNYGSRSYSEEAAHLAKVSRAARLEYKLAKSSGYKNQIQKKWNKRRKLARLFYESQQKQGFYFKYTTDEIRELFYENGVSVEYVSRKSNGEVKSRETIHYKRLFRSIGKAKKGSCMFIRDELYETAFNFLTMEIQLPEENAPIVELNAYMSLVASGTVGEVKINPKNILILKDVEATFITDVISIETDSQKHCYAKKILDYAVKNTLFDGQALIDKNKFPAWGNGYILLRHHFCKMASFCCDIQKFFRDYFGEAYYTATVKDMFGNEHYVRDIELITTDYAMKWLKFGVTYDYWCQKVYENGCMFGIVKTAHKSKLGDVQKMSYQMVNSLDTDIMENVVHESVQYINSIKQDNAAFLEYLKTNTNFFNDYDVLVDLCEQNPDFVRSEYFRERKKSILGNYVRTFKSGKILQNAENLTIVGSPYAMLLYGATGDPESVKQDDTFFTEDRTIQCYTERFNSGEYLAFFRSPFNSKNNLTYLHNIYSKNLDKYFDLGEQVIAVNMIGTDFQDRNNGLI